jgi:drug/metabolite transporter (DMT)-like permease
VPHFGPLPMIAGRVLIAGLALGAFALASRERFEWRRHWRAYLFVGVIGLDLPFVLIAQALKTIDASTAAILNALSPLFAAIVAALWLRERITLAKLGGIGLCLFGTAVLVGWRPAPMSGIELLSSGMSIVATALYGYTLVFTKVHLKDASPMAISAATLLLAAAALVPIASFNTPDLAPIPPLAWLALLGLAFVSTTVAFLFYYRLIADIGPVKASTVTLLVPVFGMLWGVLLLGESLTAGRIAGCAIILSGCALILGLVPVPIRPPVA